MYGKKKKCAHGHQTPGLDRTHRRLGVPGGPRDVPGAVGGGSRRVCSRGRAGSCSRGRVRLQGVSAGRPTVRSRGRVVFSGCARAGVSGYRGVLARAGQIAEGLRGPAHCTLARAGRLQGVCSRGRVVRGGREHTSPSYKLPPPSLRTSTPPQQVQIRTYVSQQGEVRLLGLT